MPIWSELGNHWRMYQDRRRSRVASKIGTSPLSASRAQHAVHHDSINLDGQSASLLFHKFSNPKTQAIALPRATHINNNRYTPTKLFLAMNTDTSSNVGMRIILPPVSYVSIERSNNV